MAAAGTVASAVAQTPPVQRKGRLKQGVTHGVFGRGVPLEEMCKTAAKLGVKGFDPIGPKDGQRSSSMG